MVRVTGWNLQELTKRAAPLTNFVRRAWRIVASQVYDSLLGATVLSVDDLGAVTRLWDEQMQSSLITGYVRRQLLDASTSIRLQLGAGSGASDVFSAPGGSDLVDDYLRNATNRLSGVGNDVWLDTREALITGHREGLDVEQIAERVQAAINVTPGRARRIAVTEIHAAHEAGMHAQVIAVDPNAVKIWNARDDGKTRPSHHAADGTEQRISESFIIGGYSLRFPGDPLGPAHEVINCRCSLMYEIAGLRPQPTHDIMQPMTVDDKTVTAASDHWKYQLRDPNTGQWTDMIIGIGASSSVAGHKGKPAGSPAKVTTSLIWGKHTDGQVILARKVETGAIQRVRWNAKTKKYDFESALPNGDTTTSASLTKKDAYDWLKNDTDWLVPTDEGELPQVSTESELVETPVAPTSAPTLKTTAVQKLVEQYNKGLIAKHEFDQEYTEITGAPPPDVVPQVPQKPDQVTPEPPALAVPQATTPIVGKPAKATTKLIWGKHDDGDVILDTPNNTEQVKWNADKKKYDHVVDGSVVESWTKKDAYAQLKDDTHWVEPGKSGTGIISGTTTQTAPAKPTAEKLTKPTLKPLPSQVVFNSPTSQVGEKLTGYVASSVQTEIDAWSHRPFDLDENPTGVLTGKHALFAGLAASDDMFIKDDKDQWHAARTYQSMVAEEWNKSLRTGETPNVSPTQKKWIADAQPVLDDMMNKSRLGQSVQVWRGTKNAPQDFIDKLKPGHTFSDRGYVSTSTEKSTAKSFAGDSGLLFDIEVPAGSRGIVPTRWTTRFFDEFELTLPRDSKFEVLEAPKKMPDGSTVVKVRAVTDVEPSAPSALSFVPTVTQPVETDTELESPGVNANYVMPDGSPNWSWITSNTDELTVGQVVAENIKTGNKLTYDESGTGSPHFTYSNSGKKVSPKYLAENHPSGWKGVAPANAVTSPQGSVVDYDPSDEVDWDEVFIAAYGGDTPAGSDVAVSADGKSKLTWEAAEDAFEVWELSSVGEWQTTGDTITPDVGVQLSNVLSDIAPAWLKPDSDKGKQLLGLTSPAAPVESDDVAQIADVVIESGTAKAWKSNLSAQKIGYWSKPEKIWDGVQQLIEQHSGKVTPLQVLTALDSVTKTKSSSTAWTDKITKWGTTKKGAAALQKFSGSPNLPAAPTKNYVGYPSVSATDVNIDAILIKGTSFNTADEMWSAAENAASGNGSTAVIGYRTNSTGNLYRAVATRNLSGELAINVELLGIDWKPSTTYTSVESLAESSFTWMDAFNAPKKLPPGASAAPQVDVDLGESDISGWPSELKTSVWNTFKSSESPAPAIYSPSKKIWKAVSETADLHQVTKLQVLRAIDEVTAEKAKASNTFAIEKKVVDWLKTPQGYSHVTGEPIPLPPTPAFHPDVTVNIPTFEESSKLTYDTWSLNEASQNWNALMAKPEIPAWTKEQESAVKAYTGGVYTTWNHHLYLGNSVSDNDRKRIEQLQRAMRPIDKPVTLRRATNFDELGVKNHDELEKIVGQTRKGEAFNSTNVGNYWVWSGNLKMTIEVPPGTPMAWAYPLSLHKSEEEMILAAGLCYQVVSVSKKSYESHVRLRVVPCPE